MPNVVGERKSHRIVCGKILNHLLWIGCYNGSISAVDIEMKEFNPIFTVTPLLTTEESQ